MTRPAAMRAALVELVEREAGRPAGGLAWCRGSWGPYVVDKRSRPVRVFCAWCSAEGLSTVRNPAPATSTRPVLEAHFAVGADPLDGAG